MPSDVMNSAELRPPKPGSRASAAQDGPGPGTSIRSTREMFGRVVPSRTLPYITVHLLCLGAIWVGVSWTAALVCVALFVARMFVITAFYHRYFSHRAFRTHRVTQFVFALFGTMCAQRGPIWWAAHHRDHHRNSDHEPDIHSPGLRGLLWSHMGWFFSDKGMAIDWKAVPDWQKCPELLWLERNHVIGPFLLAGMLALLGWALESWAPALGTGPAQLVVWGVGISTTLLYHATFTINSLAHLWGSRRYATRDDSRNNFLLALLTLGEGWHNNHHYYPGAARQGFYWWEVDVTYYVLWAMEKLGIVWELNRVPERVYAEARRAGEHHP